MPVVERVAGQQAKPALLAQVQKAHHLIDKGRAGEARALLSGMATEMPADAGSCYEIGRLAMRLAEPALAAELFSRCLQHDSNNAVYLTHMGNAMQALQQPSQAEALFLQALERAPEHGEALSCLGFLYLSHGDYAKARHWLSKAVQQPGADELAHGNLASALNMLGMHEDALRHAEIARKHAPKSPMVLQLLARILLEMGRIDEAVRYCETAIRLQPAFGGAYVTLAKAKKFSAGDRAFIEKAEAQLQQGMAVRDSTDFHFALGKMYDDIGEAGKAFAHYRQANVLARPASPVVFDKERFRFQRRLCTRTRLQNAAQYGHPSDVPLFVVGMPRSGTSLVEQILSSHPDVCGAGELTAMGRLVGEYMAGTKYRFLPSPFLRPDPPRLRDVAERYLQVLQQGRPEAARITDKLPENYKYLGMIALLFPRARIVHVIRHPLDTCLSCYFQHFGHVPWSFDLATIGEAYVLYRKMMAHWQQVLPAGMLLDVHYEALVADTEQSSRQLVAHAGLPWDDRCLSFFENDRSVGTASMWQVRQPIYRTSRMRWVKYAPHLGGLGQTLREFLTEDDRKVFAEHGVLIR